jgi:uncharacterized protein (DUF983 family)
MRVISGPANSEQIAVAKRFAVYKAKMQRNITERVTSPYIAGLRCRCPRCGEGKLFKGFLTLKPSCDVCGLDFAFADSGDGPAVFVILLSGALVVGLALGVEIAYQPPYWLHAVLWGPLILIVTLGPLRLIKSLLIALQYHHAASEGRQEIVGK